jgi:hypothetical protein
MHIENPGGDISHPTLHNRRLIIGCFPWSLGAEPPSRAPPPLTASDLATEPSALL